MRLIINKSGFSFSESKTIEAVECSDPPQDPINVDVYVVSGVEMIVSFDKPIGDGYKYKVTYKDTNPEQEASGILGYGNAATHVLSGLTAATDYKIKVFLECDSKPNVFSAVPGMTTAKTLQPSRKHNTTTFN